MSTIEQTLTLTLGLIVVAACAGIAIYIAVQIASQALGRPTHR